MIDTLYNAGAANLGSSWPLVWSLIKIVALLLPLLGCVAYLTLWERKAIAWSQIRPGPNRTGPLGLLQPIASEKHNDSPGAVNHCQRASISIGAEPKGIDSTTVRCRT